MIMAMLVSITAFAQVNPSKFTDNISVEVKGGISTPDLFEGISPIVGIQIEKYVNPWLGFAIDGTTTIATPYGSKNPHTMFDVVNVDLLGKVNVLHLFNYNGSRKVFEPVVFAGIGWGHQTYCTALDKNYVTSKAGIELNYNINNNWGIRLTPAMNWGPVYNGKLNYKHSQLEITAGVVYHFKNKDGNYYFTKAHLYDAREIAALNDRINQLRRDNKHLNNLVRNLRIDLAKKPKVIERVDTVMLMPDVQFRQGSRYLEPTSEATIVKMAEYMKASNKKYTLMGYASVEGSIRHNEQLSLWRAEKLRDKLIEYGVNADNLEAVGYGATDKFSKEIRELNRIVVIEE